MPPSDGNGTIIGIPTAWIQPLSEVAALYREYGSIPRAMAAIISTYVVGSVFGLGSYVVSSVLSVFDWLTMSLAWVQALLGGSFGLVGARVLFVYRWLQRELATAAAAAGPLGPLIAIVVGAVLIAVMYRLLIALLGELPVGSTIVDFLGLR